MVLMTLPKLRTTSWFRWFRSLGRSRSVTTLLVALPFVLAPLATGQGDPAFELDVVATGFERPIGVVAAAGELFVVEQTGIVRVAHDGSAQNPPFLDLRERVTFGGERGLLGLAFRPATRDGAFSRADLTEAYVHFSGAEGDTVVMRIPIRDGVPRVDEGDELLRLAQPYANHNGGALLIGPDGMLYLGLGDGGAAGDPLRAGQDTDSWLGSILRIDPRGDPYDVPSDNPFVSGGGAPEIWVTGLRNPWRFSFDPATGALWIADVGQNDTEEIDRLAAGEAAGANLGWSVLEGDRCFRTADCDRSGTVPPVAVYRHTDGLGRSVTGGHVYRGRRIPSLAGRYVFGDFVGGTLMAIDADAGADGQVAPTLLARLGFPISSFGVDAEGELLLLDYQAGRLLRLVPR